MRACNAAKGRRWLVMSLVACLVVAVCVAVACLSGFRLRGLLVNADALYLPMLFRDLFALQGRWSAWYLTPAPYIFPDYLLFLPAYLVGKSAFHQVLIHALLQLGLTTLAIWQLAKRAGCQSARWPAVLGIAAIAYLAIAQGQPYVFALMSAFHFSVFLFAIWLLAQVTSTSPGGSLPGGARMWLAGGFTFLLALSDALVTMQVVLPLTACLLLRTWTRELDLRSVWRWTILLVLSGIAGVLAYPLVVAKRRRPASGVDLQMMTAKAQEAWNLLRIEFADSPALMWSLTAFYLFAACCVLLQLAQRQTRLALPVVNLGSFVFVSGVVNVLAILALASIDLTPRYFISTACWPIVVAAVWLGLRLPHRSWVQALPASLAVAGLASVSAMGVERHGLPADVYPQDIACIDAALDGTGLQNGLTQYWDAKRIGAFSRHDLRLAQYVSNLTEFRWVTSSRNYRQSYDFAIVTDDVDHPVHLLSVPILEAAAGPALRTVVCGNRTLMIYGKDGLRLKAAGAQ